MKLLQEQLGWMISTSPVDKLTLNDNKSVDFLFNSCKPAELSYFMRLVSFLRGTTHFPDTTLLVAS